MRELRVLAALIVAGLLMGLAAGVAAGQTACAPTSTACNAPSATPIPSIPVSVDAPPQGRPVSTEPLDVLHRPPERDTASAMPALSVLCGVGILLMTLGSIADRRRPLAHTQGARVPTTTRASTRSVLVHAESVRTTVKRDRWDIDAVERAAAGVIDRP